MHDQYHRARMAFPDEDVVVSSRMPFDSGPIDAFKDLQAIRPWPDGRTETGEERAWGRRLAKRFGAADFDDRTMVARTTSDLLVFDYGARGTATRRGTCQVCSPSVETDLRAGASYVFGWAIAEFLDQFQKPAG